jgi:hypothetical protein
MSSIEKAQLESSLNERLAAVNGSVTAGGAPALAGLPYAVGSVDTFRGK